MVGTIIFKDFETGSYENMRVTAYRGQAYADMDRAQDFSSCIVSTERKSAVYDTLTSDDAPRLNMNDLFELCRRAREYLYKHDWVTIADFLMSGTDISLRCRSSKSGIYSPVDMRTVFDNDRHRLYKLCFEDDASYLCLSARCHAVNYCLKMLFDVEDDVFGISGRGVYMDVSLFARSKDSVKFLELPETAARLIKAKRAYTPKLTEMNHPKAAFGSCLHSHMELVSGWRALKVRALEQSIKCSSSEGKSLAEISLDVMQDEYIKRMTQEFTDELLDYLGNYDFCFEAKSHVQYISIRDAFIIMMDTGASDDIAKRAAALSANMKLRQKLPCADYFDGRGRAYNM